MEFREAMARLASAVTIITTDGVAGRRGMAATAVSSVTDTPPTLLVAVNRSARSNALIRANGVFAVNVLSAQNVDVIENFTSSTSADPFEKCDRWQVLATGSPILKDALASIDCELDQIVNIGTHSLFVGVARSIRFEDSGNALIYFARSYHFVSAS